MSLPPGTDIYTTPAAPPPPGVTPNFVDPPSLAGAVIGVGTTFMVIAIVATFFSICTRLKQLKADDWCRIIGLVISIAYTGVVFALSDTFRPIWDLPLATVLDPATNKLDFSESMLLAPAILFAKLAILLLYLRVFNVSRTTRTFIYGAIAYDLLIYLPSLGLSPYFCAPAPGASWSDLDKCLRLAIYGPIQGILAVVLDIYIFLIPLPTVWNLQMAEKKKWKMSIIFGTAFLGIVASAAAAAYRFELYFASLDPSGDTTYDLGALYACILVEDYVAVIVSAMPTALGGLRAFSQYTGLSSIGVSVLHLLSSNRRGKGSQTTKTIASDEIQSPNHAGQPNGHNYYELSGLSGNYMNTNGTGNFTDTNVSGNFTNTTNGTGSFTNTNTFETHTNTDTSGNFTTTNGDDQKGRGEMDA